MTTSPTAPDLDVLAGLLAEATPGPWCQEPDTHAGRVWVQLSPHRFGAKGDIEPLFQVRNEQTYAQREKDAALIVAAVNALPALIAAARERDAAVGHAKADGYVAAQGDFWPLVEQARAERDEVRAALGRVEALAEEEEDLARAERAELTSLHPASREYGEWSNNAWHHEEAAKDLRAALASTPAAEQEEKS